MKYALAVLFLLIGLSPSLGDGRADWSGYDWRGQSYGACLESAGPACLVHHA